MAAERHRAVNTISYPLPVCFRFTKRTGPIDRRAGICCGCRAIESGMSDAEAPDSVGLEVLFDLSPDLMCLATFDGYFKRVNPAFERTLGYTTEELTSRPFLDFVHPEDLERTRAVMKVMASGGELREFENRYICRDGSICWLQWNTRVGPAEGLVAAAARDLTDSVARKEQAVLRRGGGGGARC